jgi:DNA-binding XRE family transcriptional regulator
MSHFAINKKPYDFLQDITSHHKVLRKQAGFSQSELAQRSGVSLGSFKRFERTG